MRRRQYGGRANTQCAPGVNIKDNSCLQDDTLNKISSKILGGQSRLKSRKEKLKLLRDRLGSCPDKNDACMLKNKTVNSIAQKDFKPKGPHDSKKWLSTNDINNVLKQFERSHPTFKNLGAQPLDFQRISGGVTYKTIQNAASNGKTKMGMVVNTDTNDKPGRHWFAVFIDLDTKSFEVFDSFGSATGGQMPPQEVKDLYNQLNNVLNMNLKLKVNKVQHQLEDSECGVYSTNFIIQRLGGKSFKTVSRNIIRDQQMNHKRKEMFRTI